MVFWTETSREWHALAIGMILYRISLGRVVLSDLVGGGRSPMSRICQAFDMHNGEQNWLAPADVTCNTFPFQQVFLRVLCGSTPQLRLSENLYVREQQVANCNAILFCLLIGLAPR